MSEHLEELCLLELPSGAGVPVCRRRYHGGPGPHVAIVAAIRGDMPEGTRVLHSVGRYLREVHDQMTGTVDLYPCVNPLAAHHGSRNWPAFDLDLSRRFPGRADGHAPDRVARLLLDALSGSDQAVELRGAHPAFREETQAQVRDDQPLALERAMRTNVRVVWRRSTALERVGSLGAHIPGLISLEGGIGNRLTAGVGQELADGLLNLLVLMGVLPERCLPFHWAAIQRPIVAVDDEVVRVRAGRGGLFLPGGTAWSEVVADDALGEVVDPITGDVREVVRSPARGRVLAVREQPVVYPGSLVARIVVTGERA